MSGAALVWYRRDLRVHDHPGLDYAIGRSTRVVPVFVLDDAILRGRWPSPNRWWFLAHTLTSLRREIEAREGRLVIVRGDPLAWIPRLARDLDASTVVVSRDYTPFGRARDAAVQRALRAAGVEWRAGRGLLVHEPEDVVRNDASGYHVFSPFHRRWREVPLRAPIGAPRRIPSGDIPATLEGNPIDLLEEPIPSAEPDLILEPSEAAARRRLAAWSQSSALRDYDTGRDRVDLDGTSRLSQDLRWGLLSPVEVVARCAADERGASRFRTEIAWRDFYAHLLFHDPRLARSSFRANLDGVWGPAHEDVVAAWREGRTGYPVVDAAMRQLRATGWMHNRARMIVASFLTKDLLVDWRVGEAHFMAHLVDGDPASNNGGWQWAASTGTDPQPYFRVFNPTLQGRRHDPDGEYIRRWVPELRSFAGSDVHEPPPGSYLRPIVDHATARRRAIAAYEAQRGG
jgi:deoxyribodipyrimidine photo-lyase